jgi:hypothetical protein
MPIGYLVKSGTRIIGNPGFAPEYALMTETQAKTYAQDNGLTQFELLQREGRYVGCEDCLHLGDNRKIGCLNPEINSSNCLRTKEG